MVGVISSTTDTLYCVELAAGTEAVVDQQQQQDNCYPEEELRLIGTPYEKRGVELSV